MTGPARTCDVTVVMATLDAAAFLAEALASVRAQSVAPREVVIVDGGSVDATVDVARSFGARVVRQQSRGFAAAWNEGIAAASTGLIAFLDSDDRWTPRKLELQTDRIANDPSLAAVSGRVRFFLDGPPPPHFNLDLLAGTHPAYVPGAMLIRRSVFDRIGVFDGRWTIAGDVDWCARLVDAGAAPYFSDDVVLEKRVHAGNLSYTAARTPVVRREILESLRESAARKRAAR